MNDAPHVWTLHVLLNDKVEECYDLSSEHKYQHDVARIITVVDKALLDAAEARVKVLKTCLLDVHQMVRNLKP